ncbi:MAG TPA: hypothetical protein PLK77_01835, partial [Pyrinomonadaceae bacterium]|nr:hypothetical protein [Pyrinomonadaceae bacterium]
MEKIRTELFAATMNYGLYLHIAETLRANRKVFGRGRTFWGMILDALMTQTVLTLCRVYDIHHEDKTCSLKALLKWKKGQNENVAADLKLIDRSDQAVERLIDWRDNVLAHTNRNRIIGRKQPVSGKVPKHEDIHSLIDRALGIV